LSTSSIQKCVTAVVKKGVNFNDFLADRCELIIASCKSVQVSFGPTWDLKLSRCGPKLFGFGNLGNDESIDALFSAYVCIRPFADNFSARNNSNTVGENSTIKMYLFNIKRGAPDRGTALHLASHNYVTRTDI
jgi:hypothetical protein